MKFIYLIKSEENSYYKIGISNNPNKRIKQLQTGNSSKLKLIDKYKSEIASKIEHRLHMLYSHQKKEGEWFELSVVEELAFISECKKIENTFNFIKNNKNMII